MDLRPSKSSSSVIVGLRPSKSSSSVIVFFHPKAGFKIEIWAAEVVTRYDVGGGELEDGRHNSEQSRIEIEVGLH
ncbi:hypothetical protein QVD17_30521 [Tagetes erecta]|uniref:Uncharacterized protein n=1 Tax=Tagetes erecta TaxID=13708 RepID=A0AAD8NG26_TARER|nr:hypothetical protein QVD17_30521 [Tagetes erecta]